VPHESWDVADRTVESIVRDLGERLDAVTAGGDANLGGDIERAFEYGIARLVDSLAKA
jgi:hypothetical protein